MYNLCDVQQFHFQMEFKLALLILLGRLLREAEPELMNGLIQATKDGDQRKFQALSGPETLVIEEDDEVVEETEDEDEDEDEDEVHHLYFCSLSRLGNFASDEW